MRLPKSEDIIETLERTGDSVGHFDIVLCRVQDDYTPYVVWRYDSFLGIYLIPWYYTDLQSAQRGFKERSENV